MLLLAGVFVMFAMFVAYCVLFSSCVLLRLEILLEFLWYLLPLLRATIGHGSTCLCQVLVVGPYFRLANIVEGGRFICIYVPKI